MGKKLPKGITTKVVKGQTYYVVRKTKNGVLYQDSCKTLKEAEKSLARINYEASLDKAPKRKQTITVNDWYQIWMKTKRQKATRTIEAYEDIYRLHIADAIGTMSISDVQPIHIQPIFDAIYENGLSQGLAKKVKSVLKQLFEYAEDNCKITNVERSPMNRAVIVTGTTAKKRIAFSRTEEQAFRNALFTSSMKEDFEFCLETGLRYEELAGLKWNDIDFENRIISVNGALTWSRDEKRYIYKDTKTIAGNRQFALSQRAVDILLTQRRKTFPLILGFHDYIFRSKEGTPRSKRTYNRALTRICEDNNLPHISMHNLRHTFATRYLEDGGDILALSKILGHSKASTTARFYVHPTMEHVYENQRLVEENRLRRLG